MTTTLKEATKQLDVIRTYWYFKLSDLYPFFGYICFHVNVKIDTYSDTAYAGNKTIGVNPSFLQSLSSTEERFGLLTHELLHLILRHQSRRGQRDPELWNIAADFEINCMMMQKGMFKLPPQALHNVKFNDMTAEQIYEELLTQAEKYQLAMPDLNSPPSESDSDPNSNTPKDITDVLSEIANPKKQTADDEDWAQILTAAYEATKDKTKGYIPGFVTELVTNYTNPQIPWREILRQFVVTYPADYADYDRRFIGASLYLESLSGETVNIHFCIDSSGSVLDTELEMFLGELTGILSCYPQIAVNVFFCDTNLDGPHIVDNIETIPPVTGRGGTEFTPFFDWLSDNDIPSTDLAIYLTDGYGAFPETEPTIPTLWVLTPNSINPETVPWGQVLQLDNCT